MERDLDGDVAGIIDGMLAASSLARKPWTNDGPSGDLHFHTYPRRGIEPTCVVRRKQIIGEGLDNPEATHVRFEKTTTGYRLTDESRINLDRLVRGGIEQKRRYDAIVASGEDARTPPERFVTMHRIGMLLLSREEGRRSIDEVQHRPVLRVEGGLPPFPIVKGRVKDSPLHQLTIADRDGTPVLFFTNKLYPGVFVPGTILPETVLQSIATTGPDVGSVIDHPLFGKHVGVSVVEVTTTSRGTHFLLEDVQDSLAPDAS